MKTSKIQEQLSSMLPNRVQAPSLDHSSTSVQASIAKEATSIKAQAEAKEIARMKYVEKNKLKREKKELEKKRKYAKELGLDEEKAETLPTRLQMERVAEQEKRVKALEAIEAEILNPLDPVESEKRRGVHSGRTTELLQLQGTSRPEIAKLLTSLNINLSVQLSKQDTANLLACLLTCNESQLNALANNKKIPVVIKTVIKRIIEDMKLGNIETVEKLWDRLFGKGAMQLNLSEQQQLQTGILPNTPMSREAYIVIRESLLK